jgi:Gpi18-like mannosyltransferase
MDIYVISADELLWAGVLVAITMSIHGVSMFAILGVTQAVRERFVPIESFAGGLAIVVVASLLITTTNVIEVGMWALFFVWQGAQPGFSTAFYNALLNYTTLQAGYLPQRWHLLEAGLGMAGMLTVAWSTGILYMLAQKFQDTQIRMRRRRHAGGSGASRGHDAMSPQSGGRE